MLHENGERQSLFTLNIRNEVFWSVNAVYFPFPPLLSFPGSWIFIFLKKASCQA